MADSERIARPEPADLSSGKFGPLDCLLLIRLKAIYLVQQYLLLALQGANLALSPVNLPVRPSAHMIGVHHSEKSRLLLRVKSAERAMLKGR